MARRPWHSPAGSFGEGDTGPAVLRSWLDVAVPPYVRTLTDPDTCEREVHNPNTTGWFNRQGGEASRFDLLSRLEDIRCPTLVLGGGLDPMTPTESLRDIAAAWPREVTTFEAFPDCSHGVVADRPGEALAVLRRFVVSSLLPC